MTEDAAITEWLAEISFYDAESDSMESCENPYCGKPIPAYKKGHSLFAASHLPEKITVFGLEKRAQDICNTLHQILSFIRYFLFNSSDQVAGPHIKC